MEINELLDDEKEFLERLSDWSGGYADDASVKTLFAEVRRLRKIEDAALAVDRDYCAFGINVVPALERQTVVIESNPRPEAKS